MTKSEIDALIDRSDWLPILEDRDLCIAEFHAMQQKIAVWCYEAAAALRELVADRDSWEQQASDRIDDVLEQADRAERAEAERDALRADAERYRFLRQYSSTDFYGAVQDATGRFPDSDEDADAAIDAAIAQEKP